MNHCPPPWTAGIPTAKTKFVRRAARVSRLTKQGSREKTENKCALVMAHLFSEF
jgi:hypothetical protein